MIQGTKKPHENSEVTEVYDHIIGGVRKSTRRMPMYVGATIISIITIICLIIVPLVLTANGAEVLESLKLGAIAAVAAIVSSYCIYPLLNPSEPAGPTQSQQKILDDIQSARDAAATMSTTQIAEYTMEHVDALSKLNRALRWKSERGQSSKLDEVNANAVAALLFEDLERLPLMLEFIRVEGVTDAAELRVRVRG